MLLGRHEGLGMGRSYFERGWNLGSKVRKDTLHALETSSVVHSH